MKHTVRKIFLNYEKEEEWLNEMSAKGMALIYYSWCRYVFEETPNNEYIYRIELLEKSPTSAESIPYIRFLEESGVECVASVLNWVYLRKKSTEGAFDIYSDIESKIRYYKRINVFYNTATLLELIIGLSNICIGVVNLKLGSEYIFPFGFINIIEGSLLVLLGLLFLRLGSQNRKRIKSLKLERAIRE